MFERQWYIVLSSRTNTMTHTFVTVMSQEVVSKRKNNTSFCDKTTRIPVVLNKLTNSDRMCKSRSRDLIVFSVGWFLWLCMLLVSRHSSRQAWKMSCNLRSFSITWLGFLSWKYCFCLLGALQCLKVMSFVLCYSSWLLRYISLASSVASF